MLEKNLDEIWPVEIYPKDLHEWLIRLTEEFDLSFNLKLENAYLIPCLLPFVDDHVTVFFAYNFQIIYYNLI